MAIETQIRLQPFKVPNFVLTEPRAVNREEGFKESSKFALNELDEATLALLCEQFRDDVFKKAGKADPNV